MTVTPLQLPLAEDVRENDLFFALMSWARGVGAIVDLFGVDRAGTVRVKGLGITTPAVPASAAAAGKKGDIAYDSDYVYVCVADNTWKRAAISSW